MRLPGVGIAIMSCGCIIGLNPQYDGSTEADPLDDSKTGTGESTNAGDTGDTGDTGGTTLQLTADLVPAPQPAPKVGSWRLPVGGVAIGLGLVASTTGASFMAIDGRPVGAKCSDPANLDAERDCKYIYTSRAAGVRLTLGGVLAAGIGIGLVAAELRWRRTGNPAARVSVGVGIHAAAGAGTSTPSPWLGGRSRRVPVQSAHRSVCAPLVRALAVLQGD